MNRDRKLEDLGAYGITKLQVEKLVTMGKDAREDFEEELLLILIGKQVEISDTERGAITRYVMGGHYTEYTLQNLLFVCMRVNPEATKELTHRFMNAVYVLNRDTIDEFIGSYSLRDVAEVARGKIKAVV